MRQGGKTSIITPVSETELAGEALEFYVTDDKVGLARCSICNDGAFHTGNNRLHIRLIDAENRRPVKWHAIHELDEGILDVFERGVLVKVLAIDRGHHRDHWRKHQKTAVALIGFHHKVITFAKSCRRARLID